MAPPEAPRRAGEPAMAGAGRTVLVRGLPASTRGPDLEREFGRAGPVRRAVAVTEPGSETCRGFGFVTFSLSEDAQRAVQEITTLGDHKISVALANPKPRQKRKKGGDASEASQPGQKHPRIKGASKKARLIVRNLSFKCTEEDLKSAFSPFGTVLEATLPRKPDGKLRGFAFVQFRNVLEAGKALKGMNMKEIKARPVAVDWAVARDKYQAMQAAASPAGIQARKPGKTPQEGAAGSGAEDDSGRAVPGPAESARRGRYFEQVPAGDGEEEEPSRVEPSGEAEDEEEEELAETGSSDEDAGGSEEEEEEEEEDDEEEQEEDGGEEEEDEGSRRGGGGEASSEPGKNRRTRPSDVAEGRTVFVRNLSFDTEEEELEELLEPFGGLKYVRIVLHPDTEHSKGCAFAQFLTQEGAQKALQAAQDESEGGGLHLGGRRLRVDLAVSREEAQQLRSKKVKQPTGTRNLYLAREGLIRAGTKAAEGMSAADLAKRARFEELKRQKLKDQNIFVSRTRLCVHNLPKSVDDAQLRRLMLQAVSGMPGARIRESRVMRALKAPAAKGRAPSLGYAFVEFQQHEHALAALRHVNNNPRLFGAQKRPIVEFSLEDRRKLQLKERRAQRSLQKLRQRQAAEGLPSEGGAAATGGPTVPGNPAPRTKRPRTAPETDVDKRPPALKPSRGPRKKQHRDAPEAKQTLLDPHPTEGSAPWSGFQTRAEVEQVELPSGKKRRKVLPLPSHRGPKIRKRDKGKAKPPPTKKPAPPSKLQRPPRPPEGPKQVPRKTRRAGGGQAEARFEQLVEQYKRRILGTGGQARPARRSKWFEG